MCVNIARYFLDLATHMIEQDYNQSVRSVYTSLYALRKVICLSGNMSYRNETGSALESIEKVNNGTVVKWYKAALCKRVIHQFESGQCLSKSKTEV